MLTNQPKAAPLTAHQGMKRLSLPATYFMAGGFT